MIDRCNQFQEHQRASNRSVWMFSQMKITFPDNYQTLFEVQIAILEYVHSHPNASRTEIAANINGITENGVKYHMQKNKNRELSNVWEQTSAVIGR